MYERREHNNLVLLDKERGARVPALLVAVLPLTLW
jgi:hypothetical protein